MNAEIDVRNVLPSVRVPTLVIHRSGDMCLKVEEGRYVASLIPNSKYIELDGVDHLPFVGEQEEILAPIEAFLTEIGHVEEYDRVLATVLSVKIDDSIDPAALSTATALIRRQIELFKGREVSGNGLLAAFDGPARALRCASAVASAADRLRSALRIGLHTGECDVIDGTYSGFAVELAQKIAETAESGNPLVSRTVKDLVAGSGLSFEQYGVKTFDGIEGEWRLFTLI
jgi:class 3 adenylate cyclase